ncbi:MAG: hypothetical protein IIY11_04945, partial [Clostridia bacterium]|nr:hypothetical protein [Clostridia bacterium]
TYVDGSKAEVLDLHIELNDDDVPCYMLNGKLVPVSAAAIKAHEDKILGFYEEENGIALMELVEDESDFYNVDVVVDETTKVKVGTKTFQFGKKTEVVVIEDEEIETYTGYDYELNVTGEFVLVLEEDGVVETMFVLGEAKAVESDDTVIAWYNENDYDVISFKDKEYSVNLHIDGKEVEYKFDGDAIETMKSGLYVIKTDSEGFVKMTAAVAGTDYTEATVNEVEAKYFTVGTERLYFSADGCMIYNVDGEGMDVAEEITKGDVIAYTLDDHKDVAVIYILTDAE